MNGETIMTSSSIKTNWISVKTTLPASPLPPNSTRFPVRTDRLLLRALVPEDLQSLHVLRTQPEVMANNHQGRVDRNIEETKPSLDRFLSSNDEKTFMFAICLKETGEMIGIGGCSGLVSVFGWPGIAFMLRSEFWGQGLVTEFVHAFMETWWKLPRTDVHINVDPRSLSGSHSDAPVTEQMTGFALDEYVARKGVFKRSGFEEFISWKEPDLRNPDVQVMLRGYRLFKPESK